MRRHPRAPPLTPDLAHLSANLGGSYNLDRTRLLRGSTRWHTTPVCALFSHRWVSTPWSRWAFGWDRELTCSRCGQKRREYASHDS